ncbi:hypothetical protein SDC9_168624 [bioreactor metagenome]|uniref:Uncharacterized protein n=1 Tax=bioreactor metagenome TaxID=1076179 RepID=A0A645G3M5_9ZZZZ
MHRSSAPSPPATTSTRRAPRWCRPGWRSRSPACSSSTSRGWSTTSSPPPWKTNWTKSRAATPNGCRCSTTSSTVPPVTSAKACTTWPPTSATSMPEPCRPSRSVTPKPASMSGSDATAPMSRMRRRIVPTSPRTWHPMS